MQEHRPTYDEALSLLKDGYDKKALDTLNDRLSTECGFLKDIIVLNDMRYLDKRLSLQEDTESYRRYYQGIINDIKCFLTV